MKKIKFFLLSLALIAGVSTASAEEGQHAVGFNFAYAVGGNNMNNFGIGIKYSYSLSDALRIQPSFTYFFDTSKFAMKEANVDFHYLFDLNSDNKNFLYPIFGISTPFGAIREHQEIQGGEAVTVEKDNWFRFGCNLGCGYQYNITEDFGIVAEAKYNICKGYGHFGAAVGCVVTF